MGVPVVFTGGNGPLLDVPLGAFVFALGLQENGSFACQMAVLRGITQGCVVVSGRRGHCAP